jgi:cardiolipin synthase
MSSQYSKDYTKKVVTVPNVLSLFRIILIPFIIWAYCVLHSPNVTAMLVVLSGLTDVVDGFIARHFHMISNVGKALDPIADKLTQIAMLFCLWTRFPLILLPLIIILVKEISSFVLRAVVIRKTGEVDGAVWHGKVNTVILYAVMFLHIVWYGIPTELSAVCILLSCAMMLLSYVLYSIDGIMQLVRLKKK